MQAATQLKNNQRPGRANCTCALTVSLLYVQILQREENQKGFLRFQFRKLTFQRRSTQSDLPTEEHNVSGSGST